MIAISTGFTEILVDYTPLHMKLIEATKEQKGPYGDGVDGMKRFAVEDEIVNLGIGKDHI